MARVVELSAKHCALGGSDKIWAAAVVATDDGKARMVSCWGRRGASPQYKVEDMATLDAATKQFAKKRKEKSAEYADVDWRDPQYGLTATLLSLVPELGAAGEDAPSVRPLAAPVTRRVVASHVTVLSPDELESRIESDGFGITEKANGERCFIEFTGDGILSHNRLGVPQLAVPPVVNALARLGVPFLMDGERIADQNGGSYVAFDLLEWDGQSIRQRPYADRIRLLESVLRDAQVIDRGAPLIRDAQSRVNGISLLTPATSAADKRSVIAAVRADGGEGIIVRNLAGPSLEGNTPHEQKVKFLADVDAIIVGIKQGRAAGSLRLALIRPADRALIEIGTVRSGLTDADLTYIESLLAQGMQPVITVAYLPARTVGVRLVEPTTGRARLRTDKLAADCITDQLVDTLGVDRQALIDAAETL